jgi:hypothetical protein
MNDLSEYIYKLMKTRHPLPLVMSISVTDECNLDDKVILESLIKRLNHKIINFNIRGEDVSILQEAVNSLTKLKKAKILEEL